MSAIEILGNGPLSGEIEVQGSKNAVLPMMAERFWETELR